MAVCTKVNGKQSRKQPSLPRGLTQSAARLGRLFYAGQADKITTAYGLGKVVATAFSLRGGRGEQAIEELAVHAGIPPADLQDFHKLYRAFDSDFIKKCGTRTTRSGFRITLDHLLILSEIDCLPQRAEMVEEFYVAELSVELLQARIGLDLE